MNCMRWRKIIECDCFRLSPYYNRGPPNMYTKWILINEVITIIIWKESEVLVKRNNECDGKTTKELIWNGKQKRKKLSHICHLNIRLWSELRYNRYEWRRTINGEWKGIRIHTDNYYVYDSFTYFECSELFGCIILSLTNFNVSQTFQGTISI